MPETNRHRQPSRFHRPSRRIHPNQSPHRGTMRASFSVGRILQQLLQSKNRFHQRTHSRHGLRAARHERMDSQHFPGQNSMPCQSVSRRPGRIGKDHLCKLRASHPPWKGFTHSAAQFVRFSRLSGNRFAGFLASLAIPCHPRGRDCFFLLPAAGIPKHGNRGRGPLF